MMGDQYLSDPRPVDGALSLALIKLASDEPSCSCIGHFYDKMDTVYYRVQLLQNHLNVNPSAEDKWVLGMGAIHESLNRKCLPLCSHHINDLYMGISPYKTLTTLRLWMWTECCMFCCSFLHNCHWFWWLLLI